MAIRVVRLGSPRAANEGLRLGTVRRPPRGVPKARFAALDFYDVWLPNLSPSQALVTEAQHADDDRSWKAFERKFRAEMNKPDAARVLDLLAALSHQTNFSLGCYCENENRCHRSVLRQLAIGPSSGNYWKNAGLSLPEELSISPSLVRCIGKAIQPRHGRRWVWTESRR